MNFAALTALRVASAGRRPGERWVRLVLGLGLECSGLANITGEAALASVVGEELGASHL